MADIAAPPHLGVSEFIHCAQAALQAGVEDTWVLGEVATVTRAASGHWYFSLRDDAGRLECVMLARHNRLAEALPAAGDKVLVFGSAALYAPQGRFQMAVRLLQFAGAGRLHQLFVQRKQAWHLRGWFANARALPRLPQAVGVVCSTSGAALQDVLRTLRGRLPRLRVVIYPAPAQGEGAAEKIAAMIDAASCRRECEVLLVVRGGGSMEDLWAYNEEPVVAAIHRCALPVVSGIGHEIDDTLADYAADLRCPTPTAAAVAVVPAAVALLQHFADTAQYLHRRLQVVVDSGGQRLDWAQRLLKEPQKLLAHKEEQCRSARQALMAAASLNARQAALDKYEQALTLLSPQGLLQRGYSIVTDAGGGVVHTVQRAQGEKALTLRLSDGSVQIAPLPPR